MKINKLLKQTEHQVLFEKLGEMLMQQKITFSKETTDMVKYCVYLKNALEGATISKFKTENKIYSIVEYLDFLTKHNRVPITSPLLKNDSNEEFNKLIKQLEKLILQNEKEHMNALVMNIISAYNQALKIKASESSMIAKFVSAVDLKNAKQESLEQLFSALFSFYNRSSIGEMNPEQLAIMQPIQRQSRWLGFCCSRRYNHRNKLKKVFVEVLEDVMQQTLTETDPPKMEERSSQTFESYIAKTSSARDGTEDTLNVFS